jgi:hypothetical protein
VMTDRALTLAAALIELRQLGVSIKKVEGEYRVRVIGTPAGEGYFTTDLADALETGRRMGTPKPVPALLDEDFGSASEQC